MRHTGVNIDHMPQPVQLELLPDGSAWLRIYEEIREIAGEQPDTSDGEPGPQAVSWQADELCMRIDAADMVGVTADTVAAALSDWAARAEAWTPTAAVKPAPEVEAARLRKQIAAQEEQLQLLTECLLEISTIIYAD